MGLQNQLNDVSSDSIPLLLVALIANCIGNLRSFLMGLFQSMGLARFHSDHVDPGLGSTHHHVGSGLAGLIVLAEQLNLNRLFSYRYSCDGGRGGGDGGGLGASCGGVGVGGGGGKHCVVCLCTLKDGEQVRMLDCRHVFHKECFDGWLDHLNFNCPLCRSPLVSEERVLATQRRVSGDLVEWFSLR